MPKRSDISMGLLSMIFVVVSVTCAQTVIPPWEVPCKDERVETNLGVKVKQHVSGELKDQTGAPFESSRVQLRKLGDKNKFVPYRTVTTDKHGHFDFGVVDPGKYRFLPSPSRAFKQPKQLDCFESEACELRLVLEANPTGQEFVGCPIQ